MATKKIITVSELKSQLEWLEEHGMGDYVVWYRDATSMDYRLEEGLWDTSEQYKSIALA